MNAKQLISMTLIAFAGTAALADDITIDTTPSLSTKTRAEVKAEVLQARAQGLLQTSGDLSPVPAVAAVAPSTTSREAVRSEVRAANAKHELMPAGEAVAYAARAVRNANVH
jgi:hypothetical protein